MTEPIADATDVDYDPTSPEVLADPLPGLRSSCAAQCPVHLFDGLEHPLYTLSRREDVHAMLSDAELWSNRFGPGISYSEQNPGSLQRYDPPEHTLRRRFLREPFLPKAVEAFEPAVAELAASLIDGFEERGRAELHDDYASPLPITAFTRLLGLPLDDRPQFKYWAEKLTLGMTYPDQATADWLDLRTYTLGKVRERRDAVAAADLGPGRRSGRHRRPRGPAVAPGLPPAGGWELRHRRRGHGPRGDDARRRPRDHDLTRHQRRVATAARTAPAGSASSPSPSSCRTSSRRACASTRPCWAIAARTTLRSRSTGSTSRPTRR